MDINDLRLKYDFEGQINRAVRESTLPHIPHNSLFAESIGDSILCK